MNRNRLMEIIDSNGRFNLPTIELEELADHLIANNIGCVADIKAENEELKERLSKAIELPCKVGDKVFYLDRTYFTGEVVGYSSGKVVGVDFRIEHETGYTHRAIGKIFLTEADAEAKMLTNGERI